MAQPHFRNLGLQSFFGDLVYLRIVPRDHFLVKLNQIVDWEAFVPQFLSAYQGLAVEGRPPYSPVVLLKILIIAYLYNLSERQAEEVVNFQLPVKEFVGLAVDEAAPDHSTLSLFKRRLCEAGRWDYFQTVSDAVLRQAIQSGITLGQIQVVDSVHTVAPVDNDADRRRQEHGKPPRDAEATVVHKGKRTITEPDGHVTTKEIQYRGYKAHVSLNAETGLITSVVPTSGRAADNLQFPTLLEHDEAVGVAADTYTGDMAYDDTDLHFRLEQAGKRQKVPNDRLSRGISSEIHSKCAGITRKCSGAPSENEFLHTLASLVTVHRLVKLLKPHRIGYLIQELPDAFERALAQSRTLAH